MLRVHQGYIKRPLMSREQMMKDYVKSKREHLTRMKQLFKEKGIEEFKISEKVKKRSR